MRQSFWQPIFHSIVADPADDTTRHLCKNLTWNGALLIPAGSSIMVASCLGIIVAFFVALMMLRETPAARCNEGQRLLDAIVMLAGFCVTLTPHIAATFNIVPAVLLEVSDQRGVIKLQFSTAILLLIIHIILMSILVFRF